jgi:hypothetical protein
MRSTGRSKKLFLPHPEERVSIIHTPRFLAKQQMAGGAVTFGSNAAVLKK